MEGSAGQSSPADGSGGDPAASSITTSNDIPIAQVYGMYRPYRRRCFVNGYNSCRT
jgi:hypothetical protein